MKNKKEKTKEVKYRYTYHYCIRKLERDGNTYISGVFERRVQMTGDNYGGLIKWFVDNTDELIPSDKWV